MRRSSRYVYYQIPPNLATIPRFREWARDTGAQLYRTHSASTGIHTLKKLFPSRVLPADAKSQNPIGRGIAA